MNGTLTKPGSVEDYESIGSPPHDSRSHLVEQESNVQPALPTNQQKRHASAMTPRPSATQPAAYPPSHPPYTPEVQQPLPPRASNPMSVERVVSIGGIFLLNMAFLLAVVFFAWRFAGPEHTSNVGDLRTDTQSISLDGATSVEADIKIGVGRLKIAGGSDELMTSHFTYNVASWKPLVAYSVDEQNLIGTLTARQPSNNGAISTDPGSRNEWDLQFLDTVPKSMNVDVGVGNCELKVGGLNLSNLEVSSGVGDVTLDLTGAWTRDAHMTIRNGVGSITIVVPRDTGVRITAASGQGHITANDRTVNGSTYTNTAYTESPVTLNIEAQTDLGDIQIISGR